MLRGSLGNDGQQQVGVDGVLEHLGLQFHCPAVAGQCRIELTEGLQDRAQVVVRLGVIGFELHCPAVAGHCVIELAEVFEGNAQIVVRLGKSGLSSSARR